jgi:CheY-like chemotaxis protein
MIRAFQVAVPFMHPEKPHVVVVNDSPEFLELMADLLHDDRYPVTVIDGDRDNAVELIVAAVPQALIIDLRLGSDGLHGLDVLRQVRRTPELRELPTLICTADIPSLEEMGGEIAAMRRVATIRKPFSVDQLLATLDALLEKEPSA